MRLLPAAARKLDRAGVPVSAQIEERLAELIEAGGLAPGDRLPPERELAAQLGVSRMTVRVALGALERRGLVLRSVGRGGGTFVAEPKLERDLAEFSGLSHQLRRHGLTAGASVLSAEERPAGRSATAALGLQANATVYEIVRVRFANGEPLALERSAFPCARFPGLLDEPLDGSLYDLLAERYGVVPTRAVERLEPVLAGPEDAEPLDVETGAPLMLVERIAYDSAHEPVEFAHDLFRGDRTRMVVWTSEVSGGAG